MSSEFIDKVKNIKDPLQKDLIGLGITYLVLLLMFVISFKDDIFLKLKLVSTIFWMFVLPGFSMLLMWQEKLKFLERFVAGTILGGILMGMFGYLIGLITGMNLKYYPYFLPIIFIGLGYLLYKRK